MTVVSFFRTLAALVALVTGGGVTYFALVFTGPFPDHPLIYGYNDLVLHVIAFAGLSTIVLLLGYAWWRSIAGLILFAGLIEIVQIFLPARTADWLDFAGSLTGITLAAVPFGGLRLFWAQWDARETDSDE